MNRSSLSVIIVVGILTLSILGVVSFKTIPASGDGTEFSFATGTATSGKVGTPMTFTVILQDCTTTQGDQDAQKRCRGIEGASGSMDFKKGNAGQVYFFTTDPEGFGRVDYTFSAPGTYRVIAFASHIRAVIDVVIEAAPTPTPTPTPTPPAILVSPTPTDGGGGGDGQTPAVSSATPTAKTNETALSLEGASGAASSPMGAFWWVLGIGAIILVAVIAAVLILRGREDDEEYEGDVDDEY